MATPKRKSPSLVDKWRHRRKPKDVRAQFLHSIKANDLEEKRKLQEELVRLMQQMNTLLQKEQKAMPAYQRKYKDEDPRSVFYYQMLRRVGLPEIHARFAPWFLKSQQIQLNRWSAVLFARLERAFFALPEQITTLEIRMRDHQEQFDLAMKQQNAGTKLEPRQQNQLLLQRAFRECSFFQEDTRKRIVEGAKRQVPILNDRDVVATQAEIDRLEIIPEVAEQSAPPGLAPQVRGQLESHGKHVYFTYNGRWKDGEMHGAMGVYTFADGGKYRGAWKQSQPHGAGVVIYPNGVKYTGQFAHGQFHGYGVMEMARGYKYEGHFVHGVRCGDGRLSFASSGTFYEGAFYGNKRHGKGTETNALGYSYTGLWNMNRMCGPGKLVLPDKKTEVFKAQWPLCVLGEAIRLVKREQRTTHQQEEDWYRKLLRVRDDLRAQDLQYAWWDKEAERMEREEEERIGGLKKARREKREAQAAAKKVFVDQKMKELEEPEENEDSEEEEEEEGSDDEEEEEEEEGGEEGEENDDKPTE